MATTLDILPNKFGTQTELRNHGTELSKSTPFLNKETDSLLSLMDGHSTASQDHKDHTTAQSVETLASEEPL